MKHSYVLEDELQVQEKVSQSHLWNELRPSLNVQSDSIRTVVFNHFCYFILACILLFSTIFFFTFSYFTHFCSFVLYLYVCKILSKIKALKENRRGVPQKTLVTPEVFELILL